MKKVPFVLWMIIPLFTALNSCNDYLTILPSEGLVKEEYWQTKEDIRSTLMGAYAEFAEMDGELFYYGELRADMLKEGSNVAGYLSNVMNSNIYPSNRLADWQSFYTVINYCNTVLKYSPQVKSSDPTLTDFKYRAYRSEAVFLRSLAYFYLVRIYKDVPFILRPYDTDERNFFVEKTQSDVILDSLQVQLERIYDYAPKDYDSNRKTRGRATRGAVNALLADIALWKFEYDDCIRYVERIEAQEDLYQLMSGGKWFGMFSQGNTLEGIFELQLSSQLGQPNSMYDITNPQNNNFRASDYAMDILSLKESSEIVRGEGSLVSENEVIWKYIGAAPDGSTRRSTDIARSCNWVVYRLADVLLMKAEALSQLGRFDDALAIVNEIRDRAAISPIGSHQRTRSAFEDLILEERAKELAFEGKRWFDLMRMGRRNDYDRKGKLVEIIIKNVPAIQKRVLATKLNDPYGWYLPIHANEIENNMNLVQNPYYQTYGTD